MLTEIVEYYGYDILYAYLNINCFKSNPSVPSAVKFLKKTDWAREKVESFYLYQFKSLPRASNEQFELSPRDRIIPDDQIPGEPMELSLEDAQRLQEKRAKKAAEHGRGGNDRGRNRNRDSRDGNRKPNSSSPYGSSKSSNKSAEEDPWAKWRK